MIMSPQIQELIDKIKSEGIQAAESNAQKIESEAKQKADKIVEEAQQKADQIVANAKQETEKMQKSSDMALEQSSRDMLLSLKKKIQDLLQKIVDMSIKDALDKETLARILEKLILESTRQEKADIEVVLSDKDLKALKDGCIAKLQKKVKEPITFRSSKEIGKGFTISFDAGKSCFDFTDANLAEFLSEHLNAHVGEILKKAAE
jgi:V/A-type H+-transporting ATPase subunit E